MACSGRESYGQRHGQLELELGSNGGSREKEGIGEEGKNRGGEWIGEALGSLSPSSPARTGGQAGTQVRGRAGGGGGHLLLPTGAGKGTSGEMGWAWLGRQVSFFPFSLFWFFCFAIYCFANYFSFKTKSKNYFRPPEISIIISPHISKTFNIFGKL